MAAAGATLWFDPDEHAKETLKAFNHFCRTFELRYSAQYPDPPKTSMDGAIQRWKVGKTTPERTDPQPTLEEYDGVREDWMSRDKVAKMVGMFSSARFAEDWEAAEPDDAVRKGSSWGEFKHKMTVYYKPTENMTLETD